MTNEPVDDGIIWLGTFKATYPMLWRTLAIAFGPENGETGQNR